MTQITVKKVPGPLPKYELTISPQGVAYIPAMTYVRYFAPHVWVRLTFDREKRMVSITPSDKKNLDSIAITMPTRGYQMRVGNLLRQMGIKPDFKVKRLSWRQGRIVFVVPKKNMGDN